MWTAATLWDVMAKAANVAQMAAMVVAVGASLLRVVPRSKRECAELERCSRRLRALLEWPTGCGAALLCSEMGGAVVEVLGDAACLVDSYHRSTLWWRLRSAGRTATQLRDMQDVINSYYGLLLSVNAHLLLQQATRHHHHPIIPPSSDNTTVHKVNDPSQSQRAQAVSNCPTTGSQTGDTDDPAGCERSVCISIVHGLTEEIKLVPVDG